MSGLDAPSTSLPGVTVAFLVLESTGAVLLMAVLLTRICSSTVPRNALWFNVNFSFLLVTVSYLMLGIFGELGGPQPDRTICLAQAALLQGVIPMAGSTIFALLVQVWLSVTQPITTPHTTWVKLSLLCGPYVLCFFLLAESFFVGISSIGSVERRPGRVYCSFGSEIPVRISEVIVALILMASLVFLGLTIYRLYRRRFAKSHPAREAAVDLIKRLVLSVMGGIAAIIVFSVNLHGGKNSASGEAVAMITIGLFPLTGALFVGAKKDVLSVWLSPCIGARVILSDQEHSPEAEKSSDGY